MKDIITGLSMTETKKEAVAKWREYAAAEKMYRKPEYTDLKKVYNQIKCGRKVVDIFKVIQKGGIHDNHHPKLAIAKISTKKLWCRYWPTGEVCFINKSGWRDESPGDLSVGDVHLKNCLPMYVREKVIPLADGSSAWRPSLLQLSAPVPPIPPQYMPKIVTDDYYILWEVDEWKMVPPTDPWLLKRITKTLFVVLAGWDLTELEKSVMHGRMY